MRRRALFLGFVLAATLAAGCQVYRPWLFPRLYHAAPACTGGACYPAHGGAPVEYGPPIVAGPVYDGCNSCGAGPAVGGAMMPGPAVSVSRQGVMPSAYINGVPYDSAIVPTVMPPKGEPTGDAKKLSASK